jgi:hypothetical protein
VIEVADVFRRFADDYLSAYGASMLPSHRRAIADIQACRTAALGGHLWRCEQCSAEVFSYHSCKNRSCPKCHTDQTERWIEARKAEMLPTTYFHVTVTVPEELREVLRANQRDGYALLMKAAAEAIIEFARDPRHVGGTVGVLAVLHTWTQQLLYHPHVHCLVTGGGISDDGRMWHPARKAFLVPLRALAKLLRGKLRAALQRRRPDLVLPEAAWRKPWVVHCTVWGEGEQAVLDYLARYVFRVAITNARIVGLDDQAATSACGTLPGARTPRVPTCCFASPIRRRRRRPRRAPPRTPTDRGSARAVGRAFSCWFAGFPRSSPEHHDPISNRPRQNCGRPACVGHATHSRCPALPAIRPLACRRRHSPQTTPIRRNEGGHLRAQTIPAGRCLPRQCSSSHLKIP